VHYSAALATSVLLSYILQSNAN